MSPPELLLTPQTKAISLLAGIGRHVESRRPIAKAFRVRGLDAAKSLLDHTAPHPLPHQIPRPPLIPCKAFSRPQKTRQPDPSGSRPAGWPGAAATTKAAATLSTSDDSSCGSQSRKRQSCLSRREKDSPKTTATTSHSQLLAPRKHPHVRHYVLGKWPLGGETSSTSEGAYPMTCAALECSGIPHRTLRCLCDDDHDFETIRLRIKN